MRTALGRVVVCTACLVTAGGVASAQTVTAGVKAGIVLSSVPHAGEVVDRISQVKSVDVRSKLGLTGGGFVRFAFNDRFSFQPELLFVMKGVKLDLGANAGTVMASVNYLEFPLLARYNAPLNDVIMGYILAGPAFSVKAGTSAELDRPDTNMELNIDPAFGSRDFGLAFGGGLERDRYLLEARYTFGLADIATSIFAHEDSLKNRAFSVMVGIRLP